VIRPQRNAFRDFLDLSGIWRIRFDPDAQGDTEASLDSGAALGRS
jgi:hypothetical protein